MGFQSCRSPNFENFGTPNLGVWRQNDIWVQAPWLDTSYGESYEFVFAYDLSMHQKCTNYILTNLLFGLCKCVWIIDSLVIRLSPHPKTLARSPTPEVLRARERTAIHYPSIVSPLDSYLSLSRSFGGV